MQLNEVQIEAIANADAHTNNTNLPTYTQLYKSLLDVFEAGRDSSGRLILDVAQEAKLRQGLGCLVTNMHSLSK